MQVVRRLLQAMLGTSGGGMPVPTPTAQRPSANVLIVQGNAGNVGIGAKRLGAEIAALGNTVTTVVDVPASLSGYSEIYDMRIGNAPASVPSAGEQARYLDFLNSAKGNVLVLMGEDSASGTARNQSINEFITLAGGDTFAPPTKANVGRFGRNLATGFGGSIYFCQGTLTSAPRAGLLVVYDVGFMTDESRPIGANTIPFRHNLESRVNSGAQPQFSPERSCGR